MTSTSEQLQPVAAPTDGPRSIRDIITDLSKPLAPRHIKTKPASKNGGEIRFIEWHTAVRFLDHHAPGWSYAVKSVAQVGNLVTVIASSSIARLAATFACASDWPRGCPPQARGRNNATGLESVRSARQARTSRRS